MTLYDVSITPLSAYLKEESKQPSSSHPIIIESFGRGIKILAQSPYKNEIRCDYDLCGCRINPFVWVSDEIEAIYYEIPKVASSSIKSYLNLEKFNYRNKLIAAYQLSKRYDLDILMGDSFNLVTKSLLQYHLGALNHQREKEAKTEINLRSPNNYGFYPYYGNVALKSNYYKFSIIRSPFDRIVSNWAMFNQKPERKKILENQLGRTYDKLSFDEFLEITNHIQNHHWQSQHDFLPGENIKSLDYLGTLETLNADLQHLAKVLKIEIKTGHISNKTKHQGHNDILSANNKKMVKSKYLIDCEMYEQVSKNN
jgi:hypothetical protein